MNAVYFKELVFKNALLNWILGALAKLRKATISFLSVRLP
jgi:hypothetical protein